MLKSLIEEFNLILAQFLNENDVKNANETQFNTIWNSFLQYIERHHFQGTIVEQEMTKSILAALHKKSQQSLEEMQEIVSAAIFVLTKPIATSQNNKDICNKIITIVSKYQHDTLHQAYMNKVTFLQAYINKCFPNMFLHADVPDDDILFKDAQRIWQSYLPHN